MKAAVWAMTGCAVAGCLSGNGWLEAAGTVLGIAAIGLNIWRCERFTRMLKKEKQAG